MNSKVGFCARVLNVFCGRTTYLYRHAFRYRYNDCTCPPVEFENEQQMVQVYTEAVAPDTVEMESDLALIAL